MTTRKYSSLSQQTTLTSAVTSGATVFPVVSATTLLGGITLAANEVFTVVIDPDTSLEEIIDITSGSGNPVSANNLTVVRGVDGSSAQQHSAGATIRHMIIGRDLREPNVHASTGLAVHGLGATSSVVGTQDTQTLYNKTIVSPILTGTTENDSGMVFQGTTVDGYTTTLNVVDPTHNNTVTIPNTSGTVVLDTAAQTLTNKTITSPVITGIPTPSVSTDPANKAYVDAIAGSATAAAASATAAATSATSAAVSATSSANSATASATSAASALTSASSAATSASSAATSASSAAASVIAAQYTAVGDILQGTGAGTATKITIATTSGWQLQSNGTTAVWAAPAITPSSTSTVTNKDLTSGTNTFPTSLATLTGTQTLTNKDLTDSTNKINWPSVAGKNALINGGMDIWQRGTSSTLNAGYGSADRWYQFIGTGTGTFAQETTVIPLGSRYSMKFTSSNASTNASITQYMETSNCSPFIGKTISVSAQVAASTSTALILTVAYSTTVDAGVGSSWTTITATSGGTATPTSTTFVTLAGVYAVPSNANSIRVILNPSSNIGNGVVVYYGNVQLELGSTATTFSRAGGSIGGEDVLCQRYLPRLMLTNDSQLGYAFSTTQCQINLKTKVTTRTPITGIILSSAAHFIILNQGFGSGACTAIAFNSGGTNECQVNTTTVVATPTLVANQFVTLQGINASASILGSGCEL